MLRQPVKDAMQQFIIACDVACNTKYLIGMTREVQHFLPVMDDCLESRANKLCLQHSIFQDRNLVIAENACRPSAQQKLTTPKCKH